MLLTTFLLLFALALRRDISGSRLARCFYFAREFAVFFGIELQCGRPFRVFIRGSALGTVLRRIELLTHRLLLALCALFS